MSDVERVKQALSITDVVARHVELKNAGSNFRGLCPFHQEKTPSFMVSPALQIYKCFGCGKGGDAINFLQEVERLEFPEALEKAAELAGVELTKGFKKKDKKLEAKKKRIHSANLLTAKYYHHILKSHKLGRSARDYAGKRLISGSEIGKFMFGYAPNGKENLKKFLINRNYTEQELIEFGLIIDREGRKIDKFRNRLMQPIFDLNGNVIGFSGRYLGDFKGAPKYLNSSESIVFKKNEQLYGLYHGKDAIRRKKSAILVEGNIDVVSAHRIGLENIVAPLGTAFTLNQAKLLKRFADEVYMCFDTDEAGINATIRTLKILEDIQIKHNVIDLGDYQDADEMICVDPKLFKEKLKTPLNTVEYLKKRFSKALDLGTADGKVSFKTKIIPILKMLKDKVQFNHYLNDISLLLEISKEDLEREIKEGVRVRLIDIPTADEHEEEKKEEKTLDLEKYLLALIIQHNKFEGLEIDTVVFAKPVKAALFKIVLAEGDFLDEKALGLLDKDQVETYEELMLEDLSAVEEMRKEIESIYKRLFKQRINEEIMHVRKLISQDEDNEDNLKRIRELATKLSSAK